MCTFVFFFPWQNFEAGSVYQQKGMKKLYPNAHPFPPKEKYGHNVNGKFGGPKISLHLIHVWYIYHTFPIEINEIHVGNKYYQSHGSVMGFLFGLPFHHWFFGGPACRVP